MRGATWFTSQEDLVALENLSAEGRQLSVEGTSVFRLPANLTYTYSKKDWLSKIEYKLQNAQAYYSAFGKEIEVFEAFSPYKNWKR